MPYTIQIKNIDLDLKDLETLNNKRLTTREFDILSCLLSGRSTKSIAQLFNLSPKTIESHIRNIFIKTDSTTREELIRYAENCPLYQNFKTRYTNIVKSYDFKETLKEVIKVIPKAHPLTLLHEGEETKAFAHKITSDLQKAGIQIIDKDEPHNKTQCFTLNIEKHNNESPSVYTLHLSGGHLRGDETPKESLDSPLCYEMGVLLLLKKIINDKKGDAIIDPFINKHAHTFQVPMINNAISLPPVVSPTLHKHITKHKLLISSLLILFIGSIAFAFLTKPTTRISNLYLPSKHKTLLRKDKIQAIKKTFSSHDTPDEIPIVGLLGIGGAGKTTLARLYAHQSRATLTWEMNAQNKEALENSIEELASRLSEQSDKDQKEYNSLSKNYRGKEKTTKLMNFIRKHLRKLKNWVLVYDDLKVDFGEIQSFLFKEKEFCGNGQIIITTRDANIKIGLPHGFCIDILTISAQEKEDLFKTIIGKEKAENTHDLKAVLTHIPNFPLDVSVAAHYIRKNSLSIKDYTTRMGSPDNEKRIVENQVLKNVGKYTFTREEIVKASLQDILNVRPEFKPLLICLSLMEARDIPLFIFEEKFNKSIVDQFFHHLKKHSFIIGEKTIRGLRVFSIHDNIHMQLGTLVFKYGKKEINQCIRYLIPKSIDVIKNFRVKSEIEDNQLIILYKHLKSITKIPYIESHSLYDLYILLSTSEDIELSVEKLHWYLMKAAGTCNKNISCLIFPYARLGLTYLAKGKNESAKKFLEKAKQLANSNGDIDVHKLIYINRYLAALYWLNGNLKKSYTLYQKCLNDAKRSDDESFIFILKVNLIQVLMHLQQKKRALLYFSQCEEYFRNKNSTKGVSVLYRVMGVSFVLENEPIKALPFLKHAKDFCLKHLGEKHITTFKVYGALGAAYAYIKQYREANILVKKNYMFNKKYYGPRHYRTALSFYYMAVVQQQMGHKKDAKKFFQQSLDIFLENNHPYAKLPKRELEKLEK